MVNERQPIFNVPTIVLAALAVLALIHLVRAVLPEETDNGLVLSLAFIPARYGGLSEALPGGTLAAATSFFTHALVHANAAHLLLNGAWLLVFGGAIASRFGGVRFIVFALLCGAVGAATFLGFNWGRLVPMIGASGAVAGLMGATFRFLFSAIDQGGMALIRVAPRSVRLMTLAETVRDRRILGVTAVWIAINAFAAVGLSVPEPGGAIAWEAHLGGYLAGLLGLGFFEARRAVDVAAPDKSR